MIMCKENPNESYEEIKCSCGRIHKIPSKKVDKLAINDEELMLICANCGKVQFVGMEFDDKAQDAYMYTKEFKKGQDVVLPREFFSTESMGVKPISEVYYSNGCE